MTEHIKDIENGREIIVQPDENNAASAGVLLEYVHTLANGYIYDEQKKYYSRLLARP